MGHDGFASEIYRLKHNVVCLASLPQVSSCITALDQVVFHLVLQSQGWEIIPAMFRILCVSNLCINTLMTTIC